MATFEENLKHYDISQKSKAWQHFMKI